MQLHQIKSNYRQSKKPRIGRGGKRGTYSGGGQKGQKSRSGHRIRPAFRDIILRLPKLRGFKNKSREQRKLIKRTLIINIGGLEKWLEKGLPTNQPVKILGNGEIKKAVTLTGVRISKNAQKKIEAAGGKIS